MSASWMPRLLIAGEGAPSAQVGQVMDPRTGQAALAVPWACTAHVEQALRAATAAFPAWAAAGFEARSERLAEIARRVREARERLAALVQLETGRALEESAFEIDVFVHLIEQQLPLRPRELLLEASAERSARLEYRPLGVVAAIGAWNYPLVMIAQKIVAPLHAGAAVIYKPSPYSPASALLLAEIIEGVLPAGVLTILPGGDEIGAALVQDARVAKVTFTGSTRAGRRIMAEAAPTLKRLTLELGGNDAAIVLEDADVAANAERIWQRAFFNAGQTCTAIKRLLVHERVAVALVAALRRLCLERPGSPLQNARQLALVETMTSEAVAAGARALVGGMRESRPGYWFPATLLRCAGPGMRVWDEECFGPVLPVHVFSDEGRAVALANASPYGLGASVWSGDGEHASRVAAALEAGTVWINEHGDVQAHLPLAPWKHSGIGVEYAVLGLESCMAIRVVNTRTREGS